MARAAGRHGEKDLFPSGRSVARGTVAGGGKAEGSAVGTGMMSLGIAGGYNEEYVWLAAKTRFGGRGVRVGSFLSWTQGGRPQQGCDRVGSRQIRVSQRCYSTDLSGCAPPAEPNPAQFNRCASESGQSSHFFKPIHFQLHVFMQSRYMCSGFFLAGGLVIAIYISSCFHVPGHQTDVTAAGCFLAPVRSRKSKIRTTHLAYQ